jgi:hypothetical protein
LNFLAIDEKFDDKLDIKGKRATIEILKDTGLTTMVISQSATLLNCENTINVSYSNKQSSII